jgi:hypothetical protein
LAIGAVLALVAGSIAGEGGLFGPRPAAALASAAAALKDPLALLQDRSPGARMGALLQTKHKLAQVSPREQEQAPAPSGVVPHERVLSETRTRPPVPGSVPGPDQVLPVQNMPGLVTPQGTPPGGIVPFGPLPPSGGGGGGPPPTVIETPPVTPPTTPPISGVPEPSTWAMMIAGVFFLGSALRRKSAQTAKA